LNLTKIITDIQSIVVSIRMVPLESLFSKMKRLVHQLSTKANKKIDLHIEGAGTEIDKNLIEEITNPIVHLIRNAIDHGIEPEKERKEKGKKSTGNIFLKASHEGNEIWISVKDDGTGLDTKKIFEKAKEKGLIDKNITKLPDKDIWEFVFEPGFSTAAVVTDVSGRGVGMDVV